jgi:hypothetical protein
MDIRQHYTPDTVLQQDYHLTSIALNNNSKHVNVYANGYATYYRPDTFEHFVDTLFRKLVDRCIDQGYVDIYNGEVPLVNPAMRDSFEGLMSKLL